MAGENHAHRWPINSPVHLSPPGHSVHTANSTQPTNVLPTGHALSDPATVDHPTIVASQIDIQTHLNPNLNAVGRLRHINVEHTPINRRRINALSKEDQLVILLDGGNTERSQCAVLSAVEALPLGEGNIRLAWTEIPSTSKKGKPTTRVPCRQGTCHHRASSRQKARQHYVAIHVPDAEWGEIPEWVCPIVVGQECHIFKRLDDLKRHMVSAHRIKYHRREFADLGADNTFHTEEQPRQMAQMASQTPLFESISPMAPLLFSAGVGASHSNSGRSHDLGHQDSLDFERLTNSNLIRGSTTAKPKPTPYPSHVQRNAKGKARETSGEGPLPVDERWAPLPQHHSMQQTHQVPSNSSQTAFGEGSREGLLPHRPHIDRQGLKHATHCASEVHHDGPETHHPPSYSHLLSIPTSPTDSNMRVTMDLLLSGPTASSADAVARIPEFDAEDYIGNPSHSRPLQDLHRMNEPSALLLQTTDPHDEILHGNPIVSAPSPLNPFRAICGGSNAGYGYASPSQGWSTLNDRTPGARWLTAPVQPLHTVGSQSPGSIIYPSTTLSMRCVASPKRTRRHDEADTDPPSGGNSFYHRCPEYHNGGHGYFRGDCPHEVASARTHFTKPSGPQHHLDTGPQQRLPPSSLSGQGGSDSHPYPYPYYTTSLPQYLEHQHHTHPPRGQ